MRRTLYGFLVALLLSASVVAQRAGPRIGPPGPAFPQFIHAWIDTPSVFQSTPYDPDTFWISGWALDCRTGQTPPYVAVLDHDMTTNQTQWLTAFTIVREVHRPDVQQAYARLCPGLSDAVGYGLFPRTALTSGLHFLAVFWSTGDQAFSQAVAVDVPY